MKIAIDNQGLEVEVPDDTVVNTCSVTELSTVEDTSIEVQIVEGVEVATEVKVFREVATVKSVHYLLTPEEQSAYDADLADHESKAGLRQLSSVREQRAPLLKEADLQVNKHLDLDQPNLGLWKTYRQALRDVTAEADLCNIVWPVKPPTLP